MRLGLKFKTGDLLSTLDDPMLYISSHILAPAFANRFLPAGELPTSLGDIDHSQSYICLEDAKVFTKEPRKMVKVLTNSGPRWCFANIFKPVRR